MLSEYCDMSAYLSNEAIGVCRLDFASTIFWMLKSPVTFQHYPTLEKTPIRNLRDLLYLLYMTKIRSHYRQASHRCSTNRQGRAKGIKKAVTKYCTLILLTYYMKSSYCRRHYKWNARSTDAGKPLPLKTN